MINFICCSCGAALNISDEQAGKLGGCPYCGVNTRVPGNPRRTGKLTILGRIVAIPIVVLLFWTMFLGLPILIGGLIALAIALLFLWGVTNLFTFIMCPREYRIWKKGGGDPWFDTLDPPLNNDPPSVRYQELYREKAKQDWEASFGPLPTPPLPPDSMKSIDDPNVI